MDSIDAPRRSHRISMILVTGISLAIGLYLGWRASLPRTAEAPEPRATATPHQLSGSIPMAIPTPIIRILPLASPTPVESPPEVYLPLQLRSSPPDVPAGGRVLIIVIDGLRPGAIAQDGAPTGYAPVIFNLAQTGAAAWNAQTVSPPATLPGFASLLTGYDVETHGVLTYSYQTLIQEHPTIQTPTIFDLARRHGYRTALVSGKNKLDYLARPGALAAQHIFPEQQPNMDERVTNKARTLMSDGFELMLVHLPDVDSAGHEHGWMSPGYLKAVRRADSAVGMLLKRLDGLGLRPATLIILTADHGGSDFAHTADQAKNLTIPWIIAGPGVIQRQVLSDPPVRIQDTAATALWTLGIELPADLDGRPVHEAFRLPSGEAFPAIPP